MRKTLLILLISFSLVALNLGFSTAHGAAQFLKEGEMNGIRFVSGGVGLEERNLLEGMSKDYNLKVVFAMVSGNYLSDIRVVIKEPGGRMLLETVSNGPWLLADLLPGKYEIIASYKNEKKIRKVEVGKGLQTVMFHWRH